MVLSEGSRFYCKVPTTGTENHNRLFAGLTSSVGRLALSQTVKCSIASIIFFYNYFYLMFVSLNCGAAMGTDRTIRLDQLWKTLPSFAVLAYKIQGAGENFLSSYQVESVNAVSNFEVAAARYWRNDNSRSSINDRPRNREVLRTQRAIVRSLDWPVDKGFWSYWNNFSWSVEHYNFFTFGFSPEDPTPKFWPVEKEL